MNSEVEKFWRGPRWALAVLLAALGMIGPFSIDTYLPAFTGIAASLNATPVHMQQTLSGYLFGFAFMNLFHGALSDSLGRRPVVLAGLGVFGLASVGCALSTSIGALVFFRALQGLSAGAGIVVSRAVIRDIYPPAAAQRMMSQVTIFFGIAPAVAPMVGGWLYVHTGWHSIFWFLAAATLLLWWTNFRYLPETLAPEHRHPVHPRHLLRGYLQLVSNPKFMLLALASGVPFNGMFLYVLSAPAFLGDILRLGPTQFFWFFLMNITGIMGGAWVSGRLAGHIQPRRQIRRGFWIMMLGGGANLAANLLFEPRAAWAMIPIAVFTFGWALMVPVVTLLALDVVPERRGMASSLQSFIGSAANGLVAGLLAPLVMHSAPALAATSLGLMLIGLAAWVRLRRRWPELGVEVTAHAT